MIPFTKTSLDLAIQAIDEISNRPLCRITEKGGNKPFQTILNKLKNNIYKDVNEWKKDVDKILNVQAVDDDSHRIYQQLTIDFEKKYKIVLETSNCQFQTIIKQVNDKILKNTVSNTGDAFSFRKLSEIPT